MAISKKIVPGKKGSPPPTPTPAPAAPAAPEPVETGAKLPPLYRPADWLAAAVTAVLMFIGYYLTLAPNLTLEDSGELAVGSMYAAVPHPPGYPVWSIYSWLFTKILPFSNIAWRASVASAVSSALACGLLSLLVSRGSSMMIESVASLKGISRRLEGVICAVAGTVAGMLLGFNGFVWSQSVIVEVYCFGVLSMVTVLCLLLHYVYDSRQKRYLYLAFFVFGIAINNHQTLLLAAMGIEVVVLAVNPKLGRYLFLGNALIYTLCPGLGLLFMIFGGGASFTSNLQLFLIYNTVGIGSLYVFLWYSVRLERLTKWLSLVVHLFVNVLVYVLVTSMFRKQMALSLDPTPLVKGYVSFLLLFNPVLLTATYLLTLLTGAGEKTLHNRTERLLFGTVVLLGLLWLGGAATTLFMPITSMTNPPMNWGYPRTFDGFMHALTRGQYERTSPCDYINQPVRFAGQIGMYFWATLTEFNAVYFAFLAVPFILFIRMQKRERAWLVGLTGIWGCLGVLLVIMLNPTLDRQSLDLVKVFFAASYVVLAMIMGYGITLVLATLATQYQRYRFIALCTSGLIVLVSIYGLIKTLADSQYWLKHAVAVFGLVLGVLAGLLLLVSRERAPMAGLVALVALMPIYPITANWSDNEQRGHYFGFWFGHDMFEPGFDTQVAPAPKGKDGKPLYPSMARDTVLFGGTDPGRFCPTYMIFCESFIKPQDRLDPKFDRRDVYIITQNALADGTYLNYIRAHYNRSAENDPPFFTGAVDALQTATLGREARMRKEKGEYYEYGMLGKMFGVLDFPAAPLDTFFTNLGDQVERERRAGSSLFKESDFKDLPALVAKIRPGAEKPGMQQNTLGAFLYSRLSKETQQLLLAGAGDKRLPAALARDLNVIIEAETTQINRLHVLQRQQRALETDSPVSNKARIDQIAKEMNELLSRETVYTSNKFEGVKLSDNLKRFLNENPQSWTRIRMNRQLLETAFPNEIAQSPGGLYPDREIHTPSPLDSQECFKEYIDNVQKRIEHDRAHPNEPRLIRNGEDVKLTPDGRVQVAGQVAVMTINGLLTKRIFDANTNHEFYVEESFPLDWMYPHLTPFGIIMKINRQVLPELTEDILEKDHEFWSQYSARLIGNWITYDTTVQEIADFAERVYIRRDYRGFKGDPRFVRDDDAQKSFSKLRSSIAGIYSWRLGLGSGSLTPPQYQARTDVERQRLLREADFAFKQAFAFCPYSPEAVFRYINILFSQQRYPDALKVAETCLKMDPRNGQMADIVKQLSGQKRGWEQQQAGMQAAIAAAQSNITFLQQAIRDNPTNFNDAFALAMAYHSVGQTNLALGVLDGVVTNAQVTPEAVLGTADAFAKLNDLRRLEGALTRLVMLQPNNPEAWYDLATLNVNTGRPTEGFAALRKAVTLSNARLLTNPKAQDLLQNARTNDKFLPVRSRPEFQQILSGQ